MIDAHLRGAHAVELSLEKLELRRELVPLLDPLLLLLALDLEPARALFEVFAQALDLGLVVQSEAAHLRDVAARLTQFILQPRDARFQRRDGGFVRVRARERDLDLIADVLLWTWTRGGGREVDDEMRAGTTTFEETKRTMD